MVDFSTAKTYVPMYYPVRDYEDDYYHEYSGLSIQSRPVYSMLETARPQAEFDSDRVMSISSHSASSGGVFRQPQQPIVIRKTFPETWIFDTLDFNSS